MEAEPPGVLGGIRVREPDRRADGIVAITDGDGTQTRFTRQSDGSFQPETGLPQITLSQSGSNYVLDDMDGDRTTFSSPTGDANYVPVKTEQPGATQQTNSRGAW